MKTIDTSKLWHFTPETDLDWACIKGPGGVLLAVKDATTEQAQEIADILNAATADQPLYIVTLRQGDLEVVYSAPAADEVLWMARQGAYGQDLDLSGIPGMIPPDAPLKYDPKTGMMATSPESVSQLELAALNAQQRAKILTAERDEWKALAVGHNQKLCDALEQIEDLKRIRDAWGDNARNYARSVEWYQKQLDRCGDALGHEAYVADDGTVMADPLRAKIAELVEKMCAERDSALDDITNVRDATIEECARFIENGHFLHGQSPVRLWAFECAKAMRERLLTRTQTIRPGDVLTGLPGGPHTITGPCAKQTVRATLVTPAGMHFVGENDCLNPQTTCPRDAAGMKTGEGYHLCAQVCQQTGHAEINALKAAGPAARGATMYIEGHTYACEPCLVAMREAGVLRYTFGAPPAHTELLK